MLRFVYGIEIVVLTALFLGWVLEILIPFLTNQPMFPHVKRKRTKERTP